MVDYEARYQERKLRIETAIANGIPDRVPNVMRPGSYPLFQAGISSGRAMVDHEAACKAMLDFYTQYSYTDVASATGHVPAAKALEALQVKNYRWPGDPKGLPENGAYQFIEYPTLLEDEYEELFADPASFWLRKRLPRTIGLLERMADVDYLDLACTGTGGMSFLTSPERIPVYKGLLAAAEENARMIEIGDIYNAKLRDLGYYDMSGGGGATAFDILGDSLRGTMGMMEDLIVNREDVKRALDLFSDLHIRNSLKFCKASGKRYKWVMLHKGFDNFISEKDYAELYWPYLRKWIMTLIDNDITPVVYTEGAYTSRLKFLKDVPKNKVIYHFETVDYKEAKKELEGVACIMGGYPVYTVTYGTPYEVKEKVKEVLDILAPGGGYLFATSFSLENCPKANIETLMESVELYGKY